MALAASNAQSDITKCFLCCKDLIDCRMLPCIHTFCLKCLHIYKKDRNVGDMLACPMCLREVKIPQGGLEHLPVNAFLQKVAEVTKLYDGPATDVLCETCVEKFEFIATKFCVECGQSLCGTCANAHKRSKVSCNHAIVSIGERVQSKAALQPADAFCVRHPNEKSEMFCFDCKTVACVVCFAGNHQNHCCSDISKAAAQFSKDLRNVLEKLMHRLGEIEKEIQKTESTENHLQEFITDTANVFTGKVRKFKVSLDKQANLFQQELAAIKHNCLKEHEARKQEVVRHRVMVDSFNKFVGELLSRGNSVDIALMFSDLHARADELVNSTDIPHDTVDEKMKLVVVDCQRKFEWIFSGVDSASNRLVTESIKISNPCVISLLELIKFINTVRSQHAYVQLDVETSKIVFKGRVDDVMKAKVQLYDKIYNMLEEDIEVSDLWQKLAAREDTKRYFCNLLQKRNIAAVFQVAGNRIHVCSFDPGPLKQCCDLLKSAMTEFQFDVRTSQQGVMMSQQWTKFEKTLKDDFKTVEVASNGYNSAQVLVACTTNILSLVKNRLTKFFQSQPIILEQKRTVPDTEKVLQMELGVVDIITRYLTDQFSRIQSSVTDAGGKLQPLLQKASDSGFLVVTSRSEMNEVCSKLEKLAAQVKAVDLELCSNRMQKCLNSEKGELVLTGIEDKHSVSIQKTFGAPKVHTLPVQQTFGGHMTQAQERCRKQFENGVEVVLFQGDITRCSADVIVVSANKQLIHSPDIERSLLANGGNSIRDECQKHIYCEGCMDRKTVFVSGPGKLRCDAVFHAYCPVWKDGRSREHRIFSELIRTILSKAVKRNYRSLAMPAIHSDLSGYPIDDVTSMIVDNIHSFIDEKGMTSLGEIQLVDHDVGAVDSFETQLDRDRDFNAEILRNQPTFCGNDSGYWHMTPAYYQEEPESNSIFTKTWLPDQTQRKFNQFGHQRQSPNKLGQWFQQQPGQLVYQQGQQQQRHGQQRQGHQQQQQQQWPQQQQNKQKVPDAKISEIVLKIYGLSSDSIERSVQEIQKALSL